MLAFLMLQFNNVKVDSISTEADDDWIIVTSGNQMSNLVRDATVGQTLKLKADRDLTLGLLRTIPENVDLTIDMDGHALYTQAHNRFQMSSGNKVTFQNEIIVSTSITNDLITVPSPTGNGTALGRYNSYYGLFSTISGQSFKVLPTLTYKNVTQDLRTVVTWGTGGQPFYNYGIQVQLSGNNYFNYPVTGQEFQEGAGFKVLDGRTQIFGSSATAYSFVQQTWGGSLGVGPTGIDIAEGAELDINWNSAGTVNGVWALAGGGGAKATEFHIKNYGILNWISTAHAPIMFFGNSRTNIPYTYVFGPNSQTNIYVPGLFYYDPGTGPFTTTIEKNADFVYNSGLNDPIFVGPSGNPTQVNINSAKRVRFNTSRILTVGNSIFSNIVTFNLNVDDVTDGYNINAYNASGGNSLIASPTTGAYGVNGSLKGDLSNMGSLPGIHVPTSSEVSTYQWAAQIEFNKQVKKILSFKNIPDDNAMMFKYELGMGLIGAILPRNNGELNMSFAIINTLGNSFAVQANTSNSTFPNGMNFAWRDGPSTIDLNDTNNVIFTSSSNNMVDEGDGNYHITYDANEGLLFRSNDAKYRKGDYIAQINWTLINGVQ